MRVLKSSFFRLFTTGFVAGTVAMVALQPAEATFVYGNPPVVATR